MTKDLQGSMSFLDACLRNASSEVGQTQGQNKEQGWTWDVLV